MKKAEKMKKRPKNVKKAEKKEKKPGKKFFEKKKIQEVCCIFPRKIEGITFRNCITLISYTR
jgi:hypothetical protein